MAAIDSKNQLVWLKAMARGQALPLDTTEVFDSLDEATEYANSSAIAYGGQTVKVFENEEYHAYTLQPNPNDDGYKLQKSSDNIHNVPIISYDEDVEREEGKVYLVEQISDANTVLNANALAYTRLYSTRAVQTYTYYPSTSSGNIHIQNSTRQLEAVTFSLPCAKKYIKSLILTFPMADYSISPEINVFAGTSFDKSSYSELMESAPKILNCTWDGYDNEYDNTAILARLRAINDEYIIDLTEHLDLIADDENVNLILSAVADSENSTNWVRLPADVSEYELEIEYYEITGYTLEDYLGNVHASLVAPSSTQKYVHVSKSVPNYPVTNDIWVWDDSIKRYDGSNWVDVISNSNEDTELKLTVHGMHPWEYYIEHEDNTYTIKLDYEYNKYSSINGSFAGLDIYLKNVDTSKPLYIKAYLIRTSSDVVTQGRIDWYTYYDTNEIIYAVDSDGILSTGTLSVDLTQLSDDDLYGSSIQIGFNDGSSTSSIPPDFKGYIQLWQK